MHSFDLLPWQTRALRIPLEFDVSLTGGRGGGKSFCAAALILQYLALFDNARILVLRKSFPGLMDFTSLTLLLFPLADSGARYNSQSHVWTFSNGGTVELGILDGERDFARYQGRSFHLIAADEAGQFGDPRLLDLMRSCLRAADGRPVRFLLSANPGGEGHGWIYKRFIVPSAPWVPFVEKSSGRLTVNAPSTFADNEHINAPEYERQLRAATASDAELLQAWVNGNWAISRGAFFADVLAEDRCMTDAWLRLPDAEPELCDLGPEERRRAAHGRNDYRPRWSFYLAHDFGVSAPSVTYFCAESPGATGPDGKFYPRGSIVLFDEFSTHRSDDDLNTGNGMTVPSLAARIVAICAHWGIDPQGVCDDACFAVTGHEAGSIAAEFERSGVHFEPAHKKDRFSGWQKMRTLLSQAGMLDRPGLYVSRRCEYFWRTAPFITRDPRRPEDLDSRGPDHGCDAARYALGREEQAGGAIVLQRVS